MRFVSNKVHKHITSLSLETLGSNLPSPRKYNANFVILTVTVESSESSVAAYTIDSVDVKNL